MAVNCLDVEPMRNTDLGVMGMSYSRLAMPYPRAKMSLPSWITPRAHPGEPGLSHSANRRSTLTINESRFDATAACHGLQRMAIKTTRTMGYFFFIMTPIVERPVRRTKLLRVHRIWRCTGNTSAHKKVGSTVIR